MKAAHRLPLFGLLLTPVLTLAQDPTPNDQQPKLEEVLVSGDKIARPLTETVSSVVVESAEDIAASTAASMKDIVSRYANLVSANGDREIAIRGVPQGGIGGEGETISVLLDGVALPAKAASFAGPLSAWDLEQVEVFRGAQSTSQGRSSLAGAVILESRYPTDYWDLALRAGVMSRDGHDYAIAAGGPLSDTLRFRVSHQDRYDNGDVKNITRDEDDAGREIRRNSRAGFTWLPSTFDHYRLDYRVSRSSNEFGDPLHDSSQGERTETSNVRTSQDNVTILHSLRQSLVLSERWQLESVSGWTELDDLYIIDFDRSAADGGYSDNTIDERIASQELRLRFQGEQLNGFIGLYYSDSERATSTVGYDVAAGGGTVLLNGFINGTRDVQTGAFFIDGDWQFAERWRLSAGVRINREEFAYTGVADLSLDLTAPLPGAPVIPLSDEMSDALVFAAPSLVPPDYDVADDGAFTDVLPKVSLAWDLLDDLMLGVSYREGYRSGGTSISFFGGAVSTFEPEYTSTWELAVRWQLPGHGLLLASNLFHTRWRDQQVTIGETSGFETTTTNAGKSHYYGLETELRWQATSHLELFASLGYLHSEFDEFVNDGEDYAGNEFPFSPEYSAGAGIVLRDWHKLSASLSANHVAEVYSDPDNDSRSQSDARTLVNAKVSYTLSEGLSFSVFARNLLDDLNEQGALVAGDRIASRYGEPRSLGAMLEWRLHP
ncbi:outer membrane receptor protein involved in Fe transport [Litorivivens lipolytica]|uniref:Outer membrane receptor protein involved in Fe transport n=1 Tax=Litorivivens lipolytica TaxID=1524264 RepID=A0A7W4W6G7_9GAMM|nr:TonB-dependent receptor [Litorivivens lipolytica]MBB3047938.1 outer membrane receptor protein involved in Fe transport [Litorivivens lipolytica]